MFSTNDCISLMHLAFQKLGLDCANWTEPIYMDLTRCVETFFRPSAFLTHEVVVVLTSITLFLFYNHYSCKWSISNYILKLVVDIMESTGILHYALAVLDYMHPLWKINLYNDLRMSQTIFCRKAGGDEERMVLLFFNQVGVLIWLKPDNLIDSFIFHIFFICVL